MFNFLKQKTLIFNFFVNRYCKKLTDSRKRTKILADNRKSHHPIETLVKGADSNIFTCKPRSIFKTFGLIRLSRILSYTNQHEPRKRQIPKLSRVSCVTIQLTVRVWSYEPGKQCAWTECDPLSCFSLGSFAGPPGKRDYSENFHAGSRHHNTGIPANRAGSIVM